jgi:methyl-accepting chemotaxis protein
MKQLLTRLVGFILVIGAILGLILSIAGLVIVSSVENQVTTRIVAGLDLLDSALDSTADGLSVADKALVEAGDTVRSLETTTLGVSQTISDTIPLVDSVATLVGEDLPSSISAAQTALTAAESSALSGVEYEPPVPLHTGIAQISGSLDRLPAAFTEMERGLDTTSSNLARIETDVAWLSGSIGQIDTSLDDARSVVGQYQSVVVSLRAELASTRETLPRWLGWLRWGISLILVWLGIAQLGLLSQGLELVRREWGQPAAKTE